MCGLPYSHLPVSQIAPKDSGLSSDQTPAQQPERTKGDSKRRLRRMASPSLVYPLHHSNFKNAVLPLRTVVPPPSTTFFYKQVGLACLGCLLSNVFGTYLLILVWYALLLTHSLRSSSLICISATALTFPSGRSIFVDFVGHKTENKGQSEGQNSRRSDEPKETQFHFAKIERRKRQTYYYAQRKALRRSSRARYRKPQHERAQ